MSQPRIASLAPRHAYSIPLRSPDPALRSVRPARPARMGAALAATLGLFGGCSGSDHSEDAEQADVSPSSAATYPDAPASSLPALLAGGEAIFGSFSGPTAPEQGAVMGRNRELDFVFYSLESGPFDLETARLYMEGVAEGSGDLAPHPMLLRVPPIRDGAPDAEENVARALEAGMAGIVFPHAESKADAEVAVRSMGNGLWPTDPDGSLLAILIVEDREGVERVDEIVSATGVGVVFAGPGDLRRSYEGDMEAVEEAIQTVLTACKRHDVPCGITAGPEDIAERIEQGFRVFIVGDTAAVTAGRAAAGR